jgi:hypothetical protein
VKVAVTVPAPLTVAVVEDEAASVNVIDPVADQAENE